MPEPTWMLLPLSLLVAWYVARRRYHASLRQEIAADPEARARRIERLERDLFPEWFPGTWQAEANARGLAVAEAKAALAAAEDSAKANGPHHPETLRLVDVAEHLVRRVNGLPITADDIETFVIPAEEAARARAILRTSSDPDEIRAAFAGAVDSGRIMVVPGDVEVQEIRTMESAEPVAYVVNGRTVRSGDWGPR